MTPQPKIKTPRDAKYLVFLRSLPCSVCDAEYSGQSHHTETGGMSLVGSDYSAVPICFSCHRDIHQHCSKRGKWSETELTELLAGYQKSYQEWSVKNGTVNKKSESF